MTNNRKSHQKDRIYTKKKLQSLATVSFLASIKENLDNEMAFKVATDAFGKFMTTYYRNLLSDFELGSQERFNRFRESYEQFATETPYCEIIESSPAILKVKFTRCPFNEILTDEGLADLAYAYCISDQTFTENVLPGVQFSRNHEIVTGSAYCDH
ncbi:MAG: L-2-amino-thiazoline-4-carboxylic acid hydrolase, partial [Candidatus Hodarchaeales archaeon]